jgi:three-Cys-motif partner protein
VSGSRYRTSPTDGLLSRVSGEWAKEKLHYLGGYMGIVNKAMQRHWPHRAYIDLMAGPGRCILENGDDEFDGSPLRALKCEPPFTSVLLVENAPKLLTALRSRTASYGSRVQIIEGDCNDPDVITNIRETVPGSALALAFVDMLGLDVKFETLKQLTKGRRIDLAITFQVSDLVRNVPQILKGQADGKRLDDFFGTSEWRQVVADAEQRKLPTTTIGDALTDFYIARLSTLGYSDVQPLHRLMKNKLNAPLYRLVLAGKHERAADFFSKISKIEYSGQRGLTFGN